ncbi:MULTISPECIES: pentapeptide repeat-containing protein [Brevibacillus]|uniref:pentapeptide repeat-containing protein n=1 Tax=Brevibacillus TaxID=55080 RepID=UPI00156AE421|nr:MULTISPECIES: pentapeptide repeat-containing protein [Brevibacillus]MBU8714284.1 pentapeptide repeat-containing protein [Brevibacillus parabrevis]UED67936.1 pentapeptide repeat-containing protein [Brevibacillus sp. HD3.3A]
MDDQQGNHAPSLAGLRDDLRADCEKCFGLCCVALPFAASSDFAINKDAGTPCRNLQADFRCGVHQSLRQIGFRGCTVYDCFGAGQKLSQETYGGRDWRQAPELASQMYGVFPIMWQLHELLWYLTEALTFQAARSLHAKLDDVLRETKRFTELAPAELLRVDVPAHRAEVGELLREASELVRTEACRKQKGARIKARNVGRGADLIGAKLKGADLLGANLRGAYLIAADLRGANLRWADLIGADLRDTDLRGADLTDSLFLTQAQLNAAKGDAATKIPLSFTRPEHWA